MKNIIITGGCGFIGFNLVTNLMKNYNIVIIDNFNDFYNPLQKKENWILLKAFHQENNYQTSLNLIDDNLFDIMKNDLQKYNNKNSLFIHLAAQPGVRESIGQEENYYHQNVDGTQHVLNLAMELGSKQFINFSSSTVYENNMNKPSYESMMPSPISPYGLSKWKAEQVCDDFISRSSFPIITFRPFSVYGAQQRPKMCISQFLNDIENNKTLFIYGDGEQKRDFTFVGDLVKIVHLAIEMEFSVDHHVFNIGCGNPITLNDLIQKLSNILKITPKCNYIEKNRYDAYITWASTEKIKNCFNYKPEVPLDDGLRKMVYWKKEKKIEIILN